MRIELLRDGWADIIDDDAIDDITNEQRQVVEQIAANAQRDADGNLADVATVRAFATELAALLIAGWSYELPLPRDDRESMNKIRAKDFDKLAKPLLAAQSKLFIDFGVDPSPGSPT